jgi:hypothetical protein
MKRLLPLYAVLLAAAALLGAADHPEGASSADIRALQSEADLLEESLRQVDQDNPRAAEFRQREQELRDELVWLKVQVRKHQEDRREGLGASYADVDELRRSIAALRDDIDSSVQGGRAGARGALRVPDGTELKVRLDRSLSSKTARREDRVEATLVESVRVDGGVAIPGGSEVLGTVRSVEPAERPARGGRLELSFDTVVVRGGERLSIPTRVVSVAEDKLDKSKAGLGAIIGAIVGAAVDGKKGVLVGGLLGGTGAVVASRGDEVELPAGTIVTLRLERPLVVAGR